MLYAADFRERAREALKGNWGTAVGGGFVASLLGAAITAVGGGSSGGRDSGSEGGVHSITDLNGIIPTEFQVGVMVFLSDLSFPLIVFTILHFTVGGAVTLGYAKYNLNLVDHKPASFAQLFSEFHRFGTGFFMQILRFVYTLLWSFLFIIPGIYAAYGYAMTPYVLVENPEMTADEAIGKSKELMHGNRWRLFCLEISFIGWAFLCAIFTFGLGVLWLKPYMETSFAAFYREIKAEKYGQEEKKDEYYEGFYNGHLV